VLLLGILLAGCGDEALWSRWQAESALWHARALEHRVLGREQPPAAALDRVERTLQAVVDRFPASAWVPRAQAAGPARDVAVASARAALDLALVRARRGFDADAIERLERIERDDAPLIGVVVQARQARIDVLERLRRYDEAMAERLALAATDPLGEPGAGPIAAVLLAPFDLAVRLRSSGRDAEADAELAAADARLTRAMGRVGPGGLNQIADALSRVRSARHDAPGALAVLRSAMRADDTHRAPYYLRAMAMRALDGGAPESVFAYARWAASLSGSREVAGSAWFVAGQAWESLGRPDSAIANYEGVLRQWLDPGTLGPEVRFREGRLLERMGEWERAQGAYIALQARYPSDPLAFESAKRVVAWHMAHAEPEMARVAGGQAIQNLERALLGNLDPTVQRQGRAARADLLLALGRLTEAEEGLLDLWRRFPEDSLAEDAGLRAARLAEQRPGGAARADSIRSVLRRVAANAAVRRAAGVGAVPGPGQLGGRR
jgi:tetratricopeptide (TPR) repeat protein